MYTYTYRIRKREKEREIIYIDIIPCCCCVCFHSLQILVNYAHRALQPTRQKLDNVRNPLAACAAAASSCIRGILERCRPCRQSQYPSRNRT